ncbi:carboxypeptidase-like regulatory domain-containing protein [Lysobacter sp. P5_B9]
MRPRFAGIFLALSLAGCMGDGRFHVKGQVIGPAGAAVVGARVYLDDPGRTRYPASFETATAPDGSFQLSATVAPGHYAVPLIVEAKGFKAARLNVQTLIDNVVEARLAGAGSGNDSTILLK